MNIVTEITPNPETLKFKVSKDLLKSNGIEFKFWANNPATRLKRTASFLIILF